MFTYDGEHLEYARDTYNATEFNERTVEIPIARHFIARHGLDLEVGNVLRHYGYCDHKVVDRYDPDPHVANLDVLDIVGAAGSVVAISTLEHVGWDEPRRDSTKAIQALQHLIAISDRLLVTVPMGYHPGLDTHLLYGPHGASKASTLIRCREGWKQTPRPQWRRYGLSTNWAESVFVGEWT